MLPLFPFSWHSCFTSHITFCSSIGLSLFSFRTSSIPLSRLFISVSLLTWAPPSLSYVQQSASLMQNSLCFSSRSFCWHSRLHQLLIRHLLIVKLASQNEHFWTRVPPQIISSNFLKEGTSFRTSSPENAWITSSTWPGKTPISSWRPVHNSFRGASSCGSFKLLSSPTTLQLIKVSQTRCTVGQRFWTRICLASSNSLLKSKHWFLTNSSGKVLLAAERGHRGGLKLPLWKMWLLQTWARLSPQN